jgi:hypothetical protein
LFRIFAAVLLLVGCASAQKKNLAVVQDRVLKLKPLSTWSAKLCKLEVTLSEPAKARYKEMFPGEKLTEPWEYTWKAREVACEVYGSSHSPMRDSHRPLMESALCLLLQTHWVNSPFDELKVGPEAIVESGDRVQIKMNEDPALGIFMERQAFVVETHTKSRGWMRAEYGDRDGSYVPLRLEAHGPDSVLALEDFDYEIAPIPHGRPVLRSFWIAIGNENVLKHSLVSVRECKPY